MQVLRKIQYLLWNPKVATVTQSGIVTLKKKTGGKKVTITATATDGSKKYASWKITSMKGIVKKIKITGSKPVKAGKKLKLKAKVTATKKANKKLLWISSNTKYATVNAKGIVTTKKSAKGKTVKITAMATDGSGKKKTVKIKMKQLLICRAKTNASKESLSSLCWLTVDAGTKSEIMLENLGILQNIMNL